jgi:hypothetical protein
MVLIGSGRTHSTIARISEPWSKMLTGATLHIFCILFQQALVNIDFYISTHRYEIINGW